MRTIAVWHMPVFQCVLLADIDSSGCVITASTCASAMAGARQPRLAQCSKLGSGSAADETDGGPRIILLAIPLRVAGVNLFLLTRHTSES
jgi:hypothetical protein